MYLSKFRLPLGFALLTFIMGIACSTLTGFPQGESTVAPPDQSIKTLPTSTAREHWVTFTDQNHSYTLDLPEDWLTRHSSGEDHYTDMFQSSARKDLIEVFVFDDGKPFRGGDDKLIFALSVLHSLYSEKAQATDRVIEPGGRERIQWKSEVIGTTGMSVFEVRNDTTFIMLTILGYGEDVPYPEVINTIVEGFRIP